MQSTFLTDGAHYDAFHANVRDDIPFWTRWCVKTGGPVLELGSGTGRVTVPMLATGVVVYGLDTSRAFLDSARAKAQMHSHRLHLVEADMRAFRLQQRFRLIAMPFRAIACLLTQPDLRACFRCVRNHLLPEGRFIFDTFNTPELTESRKGKQRLEYKMPGAEESVRYTVANSYEARSRIAQAVLSLTERNGSAVTAVVRLRHHRRSELERALTSEGLRVIARYGTYGQRAATAESSHQILVSRRSER